MGMMSIIARQRALLKFRVHGTDQSGWSIRFGASEFLVAYGSGWSTPLGHHLFKNLRFPGAAVDGQRHRRFAPSRQRRGEVGAKVKKTIVPRAPIK